MANYGYSDGSGDWYISIQSAACNGCGDCVEACPASLFELTKDQFDPLSDELKAWIKKSEQKSLKYACATCKPRQNRPPLPCVAACIPGAITHSW